MTWWPWLFDVSFQRTWLRSRSTKPLTPFFFFWTVRSLTRTKGITPKFKVKLVRHLGPCFRSLEPITLLETRLTSEEKPLEVHRGRKAYGLIPAETSQKTFQDVSGPWTETYVKQMLEGNLFANF